MKRYAIEIRVVEVDDAGNVIPDQFPGVLSRYASTDEHLIGDTAGRISEDLDEMMCNWDNDPRITYRDPTEAEEEEE